MDTARTSRRRVQRLQLTLRCRLDAGRHRNGQDERDHLRGPRRDESRRWAHGNRTFHRSRIRTLRPTVGRAPLVSRGHRHSSAVRGRKRKRRPLDGDRRRDGHIGFVGSIAVRLSGRHGRYANRGVGRAPGSGRRVVQSRRHDPRIVGGRVSARGDLGNRLQRVELRTPTRGGRLDVRYRERRGHSRLGTAGARRRPVQCVPVGGRKSVDAGRHGHDRDARYRLRGPSGHESQSPGHRHGDIQ